MGLAEIRTQIKTLLETVPGIGKVHDYERLTRDWNTFLSFFRDSNGRINGWTIGRLFAREKFRGASPVNIRTHQIVIRGYYGLKDSLETDKTFQSLIESICAVLRSNSDLNGSCFRSDPPQVTKIYPRTFGGVLVHYTEIVLSVEEYVAYS